MPTSTETPVTHLLSKELSTVCAFSKKYLSQLNRRTGESYYQHGCEVALTIRERSEDPSLLSVCMLHDILVLPEGEALLKQSPLSDEEQALVRQMHALRRLHIDENTQDLNVFIDAFSEDQRLLPLRMAHRLNDIRHLDRFSENLKKLIAHETLHMYTAVAGRLGMHAWRYEMEDVCFKIVNPVTAAKIQKEFDRLRVLDTSCLNQTRDHLLHAFKSQGLACRIELRTKSLYSTYRKMILKKRRFDELTDRLALRIIVKDKPDCYRALGIVHEVMHPIPGKLKDYIGAPKENGYQSIHTVIYPLAGITEQPMEIQIRSEAMHQDCEQGILGHGEYKNSLYSLQGVQARVNLFSNLEHLREHARSPKQFEQALRKYFSEDCIAIFDTEDNLYHLHSPVTALDAICQMYPKRFTKTKSITINGRRRPLGTLLKNGEVIGVTFGRSINPASKDWGKLCKHRSTRLKLK